MIVTDVKQIMTHALFTFYVLCQMAKHFWNGVYTLCLFKSVQNKLKGHKSLIILDETVKIATQIFHLICIAKFHISGFQNILDASHENRSLCGCTFWLLYFLLSSL